MLTPPATLRQPAWLLKALTPDGGCPGWGANIPATAKRCSSPVQTIITYTSVRSEFSSQEGQGCPVSASAGLKGPSKFTQVVSPGETFTLRTLHLVTHCLPTFSAYDDPSPISARHTEPFTVSSQPAFQSNFLTSPRPNFGHCF